MITKVSVPMLWVALFAGCSTPQEDTHADWWPDTDTDSDSDSDADSYDTEMGDDTAPLGTEINEVSYGYDDDKWVYEVELIGWGSGVDIDIYQFEDGYTWEESHSLGQLDYDPNGTWDKWGITLPIVTDWKDQVDSVNTLFGGDLEDTMTWMVTAYRLDGMFADCAVWGKHKEYYASFGCWELMFKDG